MSNKSPDNMVQYYVDSALAYSRWGRDTERPEIYALHSGFAVEGQNVDHYGQIDEYNNRYLEFAQIGNGQRILDAGCGTGALSYLIGKRYPESQIVGINLSEPQLMTAQSLKRNGDYPNINFSIQNYMETGLPSRHFDRVIFCESFSHALYKPETLAEIRRLLKAEGRVVISDCFINGAEISNEQLKQIKQVEDGFCLAPYVSDLEIVSLLKSAGFKNIDLVDITQNVLPSAHAIAENSKRRLSEGNISTDLIMASRHGGVALGELLENGGFKYYFVGAEK